MSHSPAVDWHIPGPPERINIVGVPPITVKVTVGEMHEFANQIHERMECKVKEN